MKKIIAILLTVTMLLTLFTACGKSEDKTLTLYTWEAMFPQEVLNDFTKETGIKINYTNFDFNETMLSKLEASKGGDYDLVIADDYILETVIAEGLAQKLDKSKLSNIDNINPIYKGLFFDRNDEYTVPYGAGVLALVYNPEKVDKKITSYKDLWDESLKGRIGIVGNYRVITGITLKTMGKTLNETDPAVIEEAGKLLLELAPNIRFIKDDGIQDDLVSGEVDVAVMYTSQVTQSKLAKPELEMSFPSEGVGFGVMGEFIPVNAPHPEYAHEFINYLLRPEVAAKCYEHLGYYSVNSKADELIKDEYKDFLTLPSYIDTNTTETLENITPEAEEAHIKVWTEFKTACGM